MILPEEAVALERLGVAKIYTPDDGMRLGIEGMVADPVVHAWALSSQTVAPPDAALSVTVTTSWASAVVIPTR